MESILIEKRKKLAKDFDIPLEYFVDDVNSEQEIIDQTVGILKEESWVFRKVIMKIMQPKVDVVMKKRGLLPGEHGFRPENLETIVMGIKADTGFLVPQPQMKTVHFIVLLVSFIIPVVLFAVYVSSDPGVVLALGITKFSALLALLAMPMIIISVLFRKSFKKLEIKGANNFEEFLGMLSTMNRFAFTQDDYELTKEELRNYLRVLSN